MNYFCKIKALKHTSILCFLFFSCCFIRLIFLSFNSLSVFPFNLRSKSLLLRYLAIKFYLYSTYSLYLQSYTTLFIQFSFYSTYSLIRSVLVEKQIYSVQLKPVLHYKFMSYLITIKEASYSKVIIVRKNKLDV